MKNDPVLNVAAFVKNSRMDGPGLRDTIWLQGCTVGCPGCCNQRYWPHQRRALIPVSRFLAHFRMRIGRIDGLSLSGGEPTEQAEAAAALFCAVRALGLSTVCYTGRPYEDLRVSDRFQPLLHVTDLLIDGPFLLAERDSNLHWRGSRNQRLIRLSNRFSEGDLQCKESKGEIILSPNSIMLHGVGVGEIARSLRR